MKRFLNRMGVEDERIRLEWIAASEGDKVQKVANEMTEQIRKLGPLHLAPLATPEAFEEEDRNELAAAGAKGE